MKQVEETTIQQREKSRSEVRGKGEENMKMRKSTDGRSGDLGKMAERKNDNYAGGILADFTLTTAQLDDFCFNYI